ncbi:hypothetical protein DEO72_LG3g869 [Vigna unguiculata]|uniref:Uncharacterized protein n=1 Tax=Vigna unguiculata TaxID=3917 RepID=A0A4D6LCW0_VIGUN|nr:hypothetical protein DEO72_LG3g869 [Vigna unguiculata]
MAKRHLRMKKEMHQFKEDHSKEEDEFNGEDVEEKMNPFRAPSSRPPLHFHSPCQQLSKPQLFEQPWKPPLHIEQICAASTTRTTNIPCISSCMNNTYNATSVTKPEMQEQNLMQSGEASCASSHVAGEEEDITVARLQASIVN